MEWGRTPAAGSYRLATTLCGAGAATLALSILLVACANRVPEVRPEKGKLTLAGGEEVTGLIQMQTDSEIRIMTDKGLRVVPASEVLLVQLETDKLVNVPPPPVAPVQRTASLLENFAAPADGLISLDAGAIFPVAINQRVSEDSVFPHQLLHAEITSVVPGKPVNIPDGARVVLEVLESRGVVLGLARISINGHNYKVSMGQPVVLGSVDQRHDGERKNGQPIVISNGSVVSWTLKAPVRLREEKPGVPGGL